MITGKWTDGEKDVREWCQASSIPVVTYSCSTLLTVVLFIGFENAVGRGRGRCSMCWRALVGGLCVRICLLSDGAAAGGDVLVPSCHLDIHWVFTRFSRSESLGCYSLGVRMYGG